MTKFTSLTDDQLVLLCGGNGWGSHAGSMTSTSSSTIFSMASYTNFLRQSSNATNVVIGGGRNSFAGVTSRAANFADQTVLTLA